MPVLARRLVFFSAIFTILKENHRHEACVIELILANCTNLSLKSYYQQKIANASDIAAFIK